MLDDRAEGDERLSDAIDNDPRRSTSGRDRKSIPLSKAGGGSSRSKSSGDVGKALRSVYDATLVERVPDDFLDLLGKLS